jgi:uncharacterized protein DUF402
VPTEPFERVEVVLGTHKHGQHELFGPLPGRRLGNVIAYEMQAPPSFEPWPGRSRVERKYALLDVGVSFGIPCWARHFRADGTVFTMPPEQEHSWYVDLVTVDRDTAGRYVLRDLFIDIMIDERRIPRMLDLDEIAEACTQGWITTEQLTDGLRRWQLFLDRHVHSSRFPQDELTDFPPAMIQPLADISEVFGPPVTWPA